MFPSFSKNFFMLFIKYYQQFFYWIAGRNAKTSLRTKVLIYKTIIKPIWMCGIQFWWCTKPSNRLIIQHSQNKCLRVMTNIYRYTSNDMLHSDLSIKWVEEVIREFASHHEERLQKHPNKLVTELLNTELDTRRLKRTKPYDLKE